jgi:Icc-related predicted phosphoesterase
MKIQLLSDLHLETQPTFRAVPAPDADLLVLAGDIGSYQEGSALDEPDFGLRRFSPLPEHGGWPVPVLFVPGNHEYDAFDVDEAHARLREICKRLGIVFMDREVRKIGDVRFVGSTLWADFDALARPGNRPADVAHNEKIRSKAYRAAEFYLRKTGTLRHGEPFLAESIRKLALESQAWLRGVLNEPYAGTTVVVTHFAPSMKSADPRYGAVPGTAGFCNALDDLLPLADLWLHGHVHCPCDYVVTGLRHGVERSCRVIANPLGYAEKGEQEGYRDGLLIETEPCTSAR